MTKPGDPRTIAAANGIASDDTFGAVTPPIYLSSTFAFSGFEKHRGYEYSRTANPGRDLLADTLSKLEGGAGAVVTSSGMAAVDLVLSVVSKDSLIVAPYDCYGGTYRLLCARRDRGHFDVAFVDQSDPDALASALARNPSLVLIETPSNPLMRVVDIRAIAGQTRAVGAKVAVDNTFLSPALQRPIGLGADFVIHSTTKYLNGHSDVVGGAAVCATDDDAERLRAWANITGVTGSPFDAYLTLRGVRTLFPRIERQQANAAAIASFLESNDAVSAVHYPGLPSHPSHALARDQQDGFGAMLSFDLAGGVEAVRAFVEAFEIFTLAESLGGVESLVAHPATMTHAGMGAEARLAAGIGDGLLRLSVGLEAEADLLADLEQGLAAVRRATQTAWMRRDRQHVATGLGAAILGSSADAILATDRQGMISFWNPGAVRIFGFSENEALDASLDIIIPERLRARHWHGWEHVMLTGKTHYGSGDLLSVPALTKDGRQISVEFTIILLYDADHQISGMASILRDVTSRFDEMRRLKRQLADLSEKASASCAEFASATGVNPTS